MGIAHKLFAERSLKRQSFEFKQDIRWPFLEKMREAGCLGYIDLSLAHHFLGKEGDEAVATLICHLSISSRRGHICVKIESHSIKPSPFEIWVVEEIREDKKNLSPIDYEHLHQLILEGIRKIASPLLYQVERGKSDVMAPIYKNGNYFYLQRYWQLETLFLNSFQKCFTDKSEKFSIHQELLKKRVDELLGQQKLLPDQAHAVLKAALSSLTFITGGPGTGKTYTAGILLRTVWESLEVEAQANFKIALAAPTGKAASNLEASLQRALSNVEGFPTIKAQTLHHLLGVGKNGGIKQGTVLDADLILVDESSMIDLKMMGQLFSAIKPGASLVLLGDKHQLPSVEAGSLFADLISFFLSSAESSRVIELKTCLRAELKEIVDLADFVKMGDFQAVWKQLEGKTEGTVLVKWKEAATIKEQQKRFLESILPHFPVVTKVPDDPLELLSLFSKFKVLTPMRKGLFGVDVLNALIFESMKEKIGRTGCHIVPIMVMQNDYRQNLFNGEVGLLVKDRDHQAFVLFPSREVGKNVRNIPVLMMPPFEYAYCLSIHKSQGSEFDHVVLALPDGTQSFGREALYTGITRAKRRLEIWSREEILAQMMSCVGLRLSALVERLSA